MASFLRCGLHSASAEGHGVKEGEPVPGQDLAPFLGSLTPQIHFLRLAYPWGKLDTVKNVKSVQFLRKVNIHFPVYTCTWCLSHHTPYQE